jgi:hypothetical protein
MTTRLVPVDLLTESYRIVGQLSVSAGGVLGVLCDLTSSFLEIQDANLARLHMANKLVEQAPLVRVVKQRISVVCMRRREDLGPYAGPRSGYVRPQKYPLRVTTPVYELDGIMEWIGRFDFVAIMAEGASDFFPLFDVTVGAILFPSFLIQSPAVLFNRRHLDTLVQVGEGSPLK